MIICLHPDRPLLHQVANRTQYTQLVIFTRTFWSGHGIICPLNARVMLPWEVRSPQKNACMEKYYTGEAIF